MILLLLATTVLTPEVTQSSEEIVVVGERMRRIKIATETNRRTGVRSCVIQRKSGDARFDALMCEAILRCANEAKSRQEMNSCLSLPIAEYARQLKAKSEASRVAPR